MPAPRGLEAPSALVTLLLGSAAVKRNRAGSHHAWLVDDVRRPPAPGFQAEEISGMPGRSTASGNS